MELWRIDFSESDCQSLSHAEDGDWVHEPTLDCLNAAWFAGGGHLERCESWDYGAIKVQKHACNVFVIDAKRTGQSLLTPKGV